MESLQGGLRDTGLCGEDAGDILARQPIPQAIDLAEFLPWRQEEKERVDGVKDDPLGSHSFDLGGKAGEQDAEIEVPCLNDVRRESRVDQEQLLAPQVPRSPREARRIAQLLFGALLESDEDAGLAVGSEAASEYLQSKHRLAGTSIAGHQGHPPAGESPVCHLVEAVDVCQRFARASRQKHRLRSV